MEVPFKAVVFDAFGTLVKPVSRQGAYSQVLSQAKDFRQARYAALTEDLSLRELARNLNLPPITKETEESLKVELSHISLFDDVKETIDTLRADGISVGLCSNLAQAYGARVRNLLPMIENIVFSFEAGCLKPEPAIYKAVCDLVSLPPEAILFIGDTPKADVDGPRAFGMQAQPVLRRTGDTLTACLRRARQAVN
jgi:HAD superfamily hydrolase (TIGR01549 family)